MTLNFTNPAALMAFNNMLATGGQGQPMSMAEAVVAQQRLKDDQRSQQIQQALPALLNQVDLSDVSGSLAKLIQGGVDPQNAQAVVELKLKGEQQKRLQEQQRMQQEMIQNIFGAGGTPPPAPGATSASGDTFDMAANTVLQHEGGYVADDAGAGPTNYGVNSKANPDVNVKDLTPDKAKAIYKSRYWSEINGDQLPPALATVALDAAVNHGPTQWSEHDHRFGLFGRHRCGASTLRTAGRSTGAKVGRTIVRSDRGSVTRGADGIYDRRRDR